jgi:hypothetical protein
LYGLALVAAGILGNFTVVNQDKLLGNVRSDLLEDRTSRADASLLYLANGFPKELILGRGTY